MKSLLVLGSTGSIGTQTLDLVRAQRDRLTVVGLAVQSSWEPALRQAEEFGVPLLAIADPAAAAKAADAAPAGIRVLAGDEAVLELIEAAPFDVAVHGIVGRAGLEASFAIARKGGVLALANKESLVIAGDLLMEELRRSRTALVPVDSEHSAIAQCLRGEDARDIRRILLTASGGPFRTWPKDEIDRAPVSEALNHPNWSMGSRITVGSATLMNKALEVLEVHHLFDLPAEQIEVVVHPQSIVHSMVEFHDGSVIAQMGPPDMRGAIHYALHAPERAPANLTGFDLQQFQSLTFETPDLDRFPALGLGFDCVRRGGSAGCVMNAADEVAVQAYLEGQIPFGAIAPTVSQVLDELAGEAADLDALRGTDRAARERAAAALDLAPTPKS